MNAKAEGVYIAIQALSPKNDLQRSLQARAAQISTDLAQTRLLLFVESDSAIPAPFIAILAFWLIIIFASFSLFAALNVTVFAFLSLFALSASVRDLPDPGTEPAVHRLADDSERAAAQRPRPARLADCSFVLAKPALGARVERHVHRRRRRSR